MAGVCFFATKNLLSGFSSKQSFEKKIFPVVIFDPATFEDPTTLREIDLMLYSMWSALLSDNRKNYAYDEIQGMTTVPASELDKSALDFLAVPSDPVRTRAFRTTKTTTSTMKRPTATRCLP